MRILITALVAATLVACHHRDHACDAKRAQPVSVQRVDDNSQFMRDVVAHVPPNSAVYAGAESWQTDAGNNEHDVMLTAPDRGALEQYVATLAVPAGHAIHFGRTADGAWRTYYVENTPIVTNADFASGEAAELGVTFSLTRSGAHAFGDATTAALGHKLAIVVGDHVESAPIVKTTITGGELQITSGPHDATSLLDRLACR